MEIALILNIAGFFREEVNMHSRPGGTRRQATALADRIDQLVLDHAR